MNLQEFIEQIVDNELKDEVIRNKLEKIFQIILQEDTDMIKAMIIDGLLDGFTLLEQDDAFGPEGMQL